MRGLLEGDLVRIDIEIAVQRFLRGLHRLAYEPVEFDVVDVRSCLPTHEVQVFAVAFSAVAKSQCGAALKNDMAKHPCIRQRRQQMKMNRLLDYNLLHLVGDDTLNAGGLAAHGFSLRKLLQPEFARRPDLYSFRHGGDRGPIVPPWLQAPRHLSHASRFQARWGDPYG